MTRSITILSLALSTLALAACDLTIPMPEGEDDGASDESSDGGEEEDEDDGDDEGEDGAEDPQADDGDPRGPARSRRAPTWISLAPNDAYERVEQCGEVTEEYDVPPAEDLAWAIGEDAWGETLALTDATGHVAVYHRE